MGRVYDINPDRSRGERKGMGCRVEALGFTSWDELKFVTRVEFDGDADEGPAAVTVLKRAGDQFVVEGGAVVRETFRCHARVTAKEAGKGVVWIGVPMPEVVAGEAVQLARRRKSPPGSWDEKTPIWPAKEMDFLPGLTWDEAAGRWVRSSPGAAP